MSLPVDIDGGSKTAIVSNGPANRHGSPNRTTRHGPPARLDARIPKAGTSDELTVFCICICLQMHAPIAPLTARHSRDGCFSPPSLSGPQKPFAL